MKRIQGVQLMEGSNEEMLPGFTPEFPYIASCVDLYPNITAPIPWHWHRAVELFYMNRGTQEYTTPHGTWVFPEGVRWDCQFQCVTCLTGIACG